VSNPAITLKQNQVARGDDDLTPLARLVTSTSGLIVTRSAILIFVLAAWELASGRLISKYWLSSPSAIGGTLWGWIEDGTLWGHLGATLSEMSIGYLLGSLAGISVGLLLGFMPRVYRVVIPFFGGLYCLPKVALAPLFVIFLGIDLGSKVALVAITVFFLILYSTLDGVNDIDRDLVHALRLMGAKRWEISRKVLIPGCLRWVFTGLRIAVRYAFTAAILGEVIAANRGIGYLIEANAGQYDSTGVFAAVLVLVLCSLTLSELLTRWEKARGGGGTGFGRAS
jgi:NitT/TauT family transport system permease protein